MYVSRVVFFVACGCLTVAPYRKQYKDKTGKDASGDKRSVQKLRRKVEDAKKSLSTQHQVDIEIDAFFEGQDFTWKLSRAKFEELNLDLFSALSLAHCVLLVLCVCAR